MLRLLVLLLLAPALAAPTKALAQGYVDHPRLLFDAADIPSLQNKVKGNGTSAVTYRTVRTEAKDALSLPPDTLLAELEGLSTIPELSLIHVLGGTSLDKADDGWSHGEPRGVAVPSDHGAKVREVVLHLARTRDVDDDDFDSSLRLRTLALGYDMAFDEATPAERQEVRDEILSYLTFMPSHYEYYRYAENPHASNRGMMVGAAMGLGVLSLWGDVPPAQQASLQPLLDFAHELVVKVLTDILPVDGSYREGVLYAGWMLRHAIPYIEARKRFDGTDLAADTRLKRVAEWLCYEVLPEGGGRTNNLNDSLWRTRPLAVHTTYLDWAEMRYDSFFAAWVRKHIVGEFGYDHGSSADRVATILWNQDLPPAEPAVMLDNGRLFADRGIYFYRSAWKTTAVGDEILLSFHSSPFRGGHAQEDQNSFTLVAYGDRYVVDHGSPNGTQMPKESEAHNLILIDGRGQHNAGNSIGTDGRIADAMLTASLDYVCGDASSAYTTYSPLNAPDEPFPGTDWSWGYDGGNPVQRAERLLLSVKGDGIPTYFLMADDIRKDDNPHEYAWLLHTDSTNVVDISSNPVVITGQQSSMDILFANPQRADGLLLDSWPFDHGGEDPGSITLRARCTAVEPGFFVALLPHTPSMQPPSIAAGVNGTADASDLMLIWGDVRDDAVFNPSRLRLAGDIGTNARLAFVRSDATAIRGYLVADGSLLTFQGENVLLLGEPATAVLSEGTLHLSRQDISFVAYGGNVDQVLGPEGPMAYVQDGETVRSDFVTDVRDPVSPQPDRRPVVLEDSRPNPFRAGTQVRFTATQQGRVRVRVFDALGRLVCVLMDEVRPAGETRVFWDGTDLRGERQASGTYFVQVQSAGQVTTRKIVVLR